MLHIDLTPGFVQAVRDAVDTVAVAEDYTKLQRRGGRWVGLCPIHKEKTPSFSVDGDRGLFYCFGCGAGGDGIKLHMTLSGDDFPAAIESLARRFGVPLPAPSTGRREKPGRDLEAVLEAANAWFRDQLTRHPGAREYLERRGIPATLVAGYELGYAPEGWDGLVDALGRKVGTAALEAAGLAAPSERRAGSVYDRFRHRLMFPIRNASGRLLGFGGRTLGDDRAKYINTRETERFQKGSILYGLDRGKKEIRESGRAILVEGYFDVLAVAAAGYEGAVASMGTSLTEDQARLLGRYAEEVVIAYDGDDAGEAAGRRALPILLAAGLAVRRARLGAGEDPDSLRQAAGAEVLRERLDTAPDAVELELDRLLPPEGAGDPHRAAKLAGPAAELLAPIRDPIVRYAWGRRAADRLGIPFELLAPTLGGGGGPRRAAAPAPPRPRDERSPGQDMERAALRELVAVLEAESSRPGAVQDPPRVDELPPPEVFWDAECRNIFEAFRGLYRGEGGGEGLPTLAGLRSKLEVAGASVDLLARIVLEGPDARGGAPGRAIAPEAKLREFLGKLRRRWLDQRRRELEREIREAQTAGDAVRLAELVELKTELGRQYYAR